MIPHTNIKGQEIRRIVQSDLEISEKINKKILNTFAGNIEVEWDYESEVSPIGQLGYFVQYLKTSGLFENFVSECPLFYTSNNAPKNIDILGSGLLSILTGQKRYAHIERLRGDTLSAQLIGMKKIMSSDAVRRAFVETDEKQAEQWLFRNLQRTYLPLLQEKWIMDVDVSVKVLYGKQEGAVRGYNPEKPGRPSHTIHSYFIGEIRLGLDSEIQAGNHTAGSYSCPKLWRLWETFNKNNRPSLIRGDCSYGHESLINECEQRGQDYLFRLRMSPNIKKIVFNLSSSQEWVKINNDLEAIETSIKLMGWSRARRVVITRKKINRTQKENKTENLDAQLNLEFGDEILKEKSYEYHALVTNLKYSIEVIVQLYNDRAGSENIFDELFNQWGWGGFVTKDLKRCQIWSKMTILIYNWWSIFVRLLSPRKHVEAVTSRPILLESIGRTISHADNKKIKITPIHSKGKFIQKAFEKLAEFFNLLNSNAPQLNQIQKWNLILSKAFQKYLKKILETVPDCLLPVFTT